MLIWSAKYVEEHGGSESNLTLHGQERNFGNYGMCKMNMILHGIENFRIEHENVLTNPLLVQDGKLLTYDRVLANFPFSMDWDSSKAAKDPYGRFQFGLAPSKGKADFAFIQHIFSILNQQGVAAVISSQGVLFRGNDEAKIRQQMIKSDVIETVIDLPSSLFFGTGIPACILILNKNKVQQRKNKILFIYAARDYEELPKRGRLRNSDIKKIVSAFHDYKDRDKYCHIATMEEIIENEFSLNVPTYVDTFEEKARINISRGNLQLEGLAKEIQKSERQLQSNLDRIGLGEITLAYEKLIDQTVKLREKAIENLLSRGSDKEQYKQVKSIFRTLEDIPKNWNFVKLWEITPKTSGSVKIGPFGSSLKKDELRLQGEVKTIWIENIINNEFSWNFQRYITKEKYHELREFTVRPNDVVITMMGTVGKVAVIPKDIGEAIISSHLLKITLDHNRCLPKYLYYYLMSDFIKRQIIRESHGIVMQGLNTKIVKSLLVKLPPREEQEKIVTILSNLDEVLKIRREYLNTMDSLQGNFIQQLLNGALRVNF
jgi:type I restriction-modification system DNA methylase subunit